ncbi:hypothetical protein HZA56_06300 [Candidatus Poribacteria bacterium]|nr:hypothetical protein [Candidatus Poribacteria bacterium]
MRRRTIGALIVAGVITICSVLYSIYRPNEGPQVMKYPFKHSTTKVEARPHDRGEEIRKEERIVELEERIKELTEQYESRIESLETLLAQKQPLALDCIENAKIAEEALSNTGIHGHVYGSGRRLTQYIDIRVTAENTKKRQSVTSNEDGYYEIKNLRPGFYYTECELYPGDSVMLEVLLGKMTTQDFGSKNLGRLFGTVYDESGMPVKARIQFMGPRYNIISANSDENGDYQVLDMPPDHYTVSIRKSGSWWNIPAASIKVPENQSETKHDIHLSSLSISGHVYDEQTREPVPNVKIQTDYESDGARGLIITESKKDGYFILEGLMPDEEYTVGFWPEGYAYKHIVVSMKKQKITNYDIGLIPVNPLWLFIKDQFNEPVEEAIVYSLNSESVSMAVGPLPPEKDGFFVIRNVGPGEYKIGITADGYEPFKGTIILPKKGYPKDEPFQITINRL